MGARFQRRAAGAAARAGMGGCADLVLWRTRRGRPRNMSAEAPAAKKLKEDGGASPPSSLRRPSRRAGEPPSCRARRARRAGRAPEAAVEHATERNCSDGDGRAEADRVLLLGRQSPQDQFSPIQASQTHEGWVPISVLLTVWRSGADD